MSLRGRLLLAAAAMVLIALVVADFISYSQLRSYLYGQIDSSLQNTHAAIELDLAKEGTLPRVVGAYVELRDGRDNVIPSSINQFGLGNIKTLPDLPGHISGFVPHSASNEPARYFNVGSDQPGGPMFRVRASPLGDGQLIIAVPLDQLTRTLHHQAVVEFGVTAFALLGVVALGWWLIRLSLRPLVDMEQTASAIAEGELSRRVPAEPATTEVGRLAHTLNVMLGRIQDAFAARDATEHQLRQSEERLRRFVADASHELRTPVAAVGAYAELFERGAASRPPDLARVMAGIRSETARMGELVEDLLLLARLDEGRPLERQPVELVGIAAEAVNAATAVGPEWPVRLEATRAIEVVGDGARLRQVLDNLLSNVRAHTPPGTSTVVRVGTRDRTGVIEVADNGPGLPPEAAGRVFERFYRADPSRSRQKGGAGLGLAIVAAIVAAHGGTVAARTTGERGATFTVWLPLADASAEHTVDHPVDHQADHTANQPAGPWAGQPATIPRPYPAPSPAAAAGGPVRYPADPTPAASPTPPADPMSPADPTPAGAHPASPTPAASPTSLAAGPTSPAAGTGPPPAGTPPPSVLVDPR